MKQKARTMAAALLLALAVLLFCTKSSPLYPINDWADANIYFTIGKGMTRGQVVYRDLYDHKGPLLYALHALCALVSFSDFTGVFVMEMLLAAAFLYLTQRFCERSGCGKLSWVLTAVTALVVYTSVSFAEGDSAEEMSLPLVMGTMVTLQPFLMEKTKRLSTSALVLSGVLAGCVFWIKFTMIGLHAGLLLTLVLIHAARREGRECLRVIGWLIAGFALSTLPWVVYFGLNGALGDWLKTYLYDNLFLYGGAEGAGLVSRLKEMLKCGAAWLAANPGYTVPMLLGLVLSLREGKKQALCLWLMAGLGALGTFIGGKSYVYYGLALAPCCVPGLAWVGKAIAERVKACPGWIPAVLCAVCVAVCPFISPNPHPAYGVSMGQSRDTVMQYQIAKLLEGSPDASLLNYGFMDAGFYTASGLVPKVKYFHRTNVPLTEMLDEQDRYIREGVCDFVISRGGGPAELFTDYEPVGTAQSHGFWYESVTLFRRKE